MAIIKLTGNVGIMPEGEHVLKITEVEYNEEFGKVSVTMRNKSGSKHYERFSLLDTNGVPNEKACGSFSLMAKVAMGDMNLEEVDPVNLIGHFIKGTIVHREYEGNDGQMHKATAKEKGSYWEIPTEAEIAEFGGAVKQSVNDFLGR